MARKQIPNICYVRRFPIPKKFVGITLPPFGIFVLKGYEDDKCLMVHEMKHWEQYLRYGVLKQAVMYLYYHLKYGYDNNPLENEARAAQAECASSL